MSCLEAVVIFCPVAVVVSVQSSRRRCNRCDRWHGNISRCNIRAITAGALWDGRHSRRVPSGEMQPSECVAVIMLSILSCACKAYKPWCVGHTVVQTSYPKLRRRLGRGSILQDPVQPNLQTYWPNPVQSMMSLCVPIHTQSNPLVLTWIGL